MLNKAFHSILLWNTFQTVLMCIVVSTYPQNHYSLFLTKSFPSMILNLQTVLAPIFKQSFLYIRFSWTLPKSGIFQWTPKISNFFLLKEKPTFPSILNWIIQILHYNCRNQHKNIKNSRIIEENVAISLCSSLCLLRLALLLPSSTAGYSQFLDTVLNVTSYHSCCIQFHFLLWKWLFLS